MEEIMKIMKDLSDQRKGVDVTDELKDLFQIYTDAEKHLEQKKDAVFNQLLGYMRRFIEVYDEHSKTRAKLDRLKNKVTHDDKQEEDEEDEE